MVTLLTCTTGPKASDWILSVTLVGISVSRCLGVVGLVGGNLTLQGTDISHHGKTTKIIQKSLGGGYVGSQE